MTENSENLIKIVNELHDKLNPLGVDNLALNLPQIAVIGGQSAGKSSVLESFVGRDFLPRGNNIVTRRPLILQLVNNRTDPKSYGEFLHLPGKRFYDFSQIRDEINNETNREVKDNYGISPKPINLKIYSPDVLDLTLVDLPGMTRIPVGNQPKDIESRIKKMLLEHIEKENCLILAVTAANQDLATSDALKLAEMVDPEGKRTIGVLTKLDLMDKGTNARDILLGKHLPLKMGYIGIVNRSQRDIDTKKDMHKALADEQEYFKNHPSYKDIANRQGVGFLQKYLNKELTKHILRILPPLKYQFQTVLNDLNEKLEEIEFPVEDNEKILAESNELFRKSYESSIGGKGVKIDITKLSGGARINLVMNDSYAKEINQMVYDENKMRREIATAIQNFYGIYLGVFTPDAAFRAVVEHQIELFRKPSIVCVEWVSQELETIIKESVSKIKRFSNLKHLYLKLTIDFLREAKKTCKSKVDHFVEAEKCYLNTLHEDFTGTKSIEDMKPISDSQLKVSAQVVDERASKLRDNTDPEMRTGWITYKKNGLLNEYLFVLKGKTLSWYKDEKMKEKKSAVSLKDAKVEQGENTQADVLILHIGKWAIKTMELLFESKETADQWREWLEESGVKSDGNKSAFYANSDTYSVSNMSIDMSEDISGSQEEMAYADHMRAPVDQVKRLVDSYVLITKKKFKDYIPKMCTIEMVDSTLEFIATKLRVKVRDSIKSMDDIIEGDPDEELRRDLTKKEELYSEAVDIIEKFTRYDHAIK